MTDFQHFLVPIDGSASSALAYQKAVYLATQCQAQLTLLYVVDMNHELSALEQVGTGGYIPAELIRKGEHIVQAIKESVPSSLPTKTVVKIGMPTEQIIQYCQEHRDIDLIIMGNRGLGKLKQMLLGSVSRNVILHAPVPVMIVKAPLDAS